MAEASADAAVESAEVNIESEVAASQDGELFPNRPSADAAELLKRQFQELAKNPAGKGDRSTVDKIYRMPKWMAEDAELFPDALITFHPSGNGRDANEHDVEALCKLIFEKRKYSVPVAFPCVTSSVLKLYEKHKVGWSAMNGTEKITACDAMWKTLRGKF